MDDAQPNPPEVDDGADDFEDTFREVLNQPRQPPHLPQRDEDDGHDGDQNGQEPNPPPPPPQQQPEAPPQPRRTLHERKTTTRPGNIYGESCNPVDQIKDIERSGKWKKLVGEPSSRSRMEQPKQQEQVPGPSSQPDPDSDNAQSDEENLMAKLCQEGGVELINHSLTKAVPLYELLLIESNVRE